MDHLTAKVLLISKLFTNKQVSELAVHYRTTIPDVIDRLKSRITTKKRGDFFIASIDFTDNKSLINVRDKVLI